MSVDWKRFCYIRRAVKCLRETWVCSPQPAVLSPLHDKLLVSSCWERANAEKLSTRVTPPPGPPLLPPLAGLSPPRFHLQATKVRWGWPGLRAANRGKENVGTLISEVFQPWPHMQELWLCWPGNACQQDAQLNSSTMLTSLKQRHQRHF